MEREQGGFPDQHRKVDRSVCTLDIMELVLLKGNLAITKENPVVVE